MSDPGPTLPVARALAAQAVNAAQTIGEGRERVGEQPARGRPAACLS